MGKKSIETLVGLFVLLGMAGLVFLSLKAANLASFSGGDTYTLQARFDNIGGLKARAPVRSAGVTIGRIASISFDPQTYQGVVQLEIDRKLQFPRDTSAKILTAGLLGDQYIGLTPGADERMLAAGETHPPDAVRGRAREPDRPVHQQPRRRGRIDRRRRRWQHGRGAREVNAIASAMGAGAAPVSTSGLARSLRLVLLALMLAAGAGCATLPPDATPAQRADPFEAWNRKVFDFNDGLDEAILKPIATVYAEIFPPIVRRGVDNFYANMADAWSAVNSLLQGQPYIALQSAFRFAVNSTFGILGIIDVAADMNIDRHPEDFGQTLGVWGAEPGPYLVWPLIGSSTVRDSIALPLDYAMSPMNLLNAGATPVAIWSLRLVNTRAGLLDATALIDQIALDKYGFIRDAYLQRRGSMIRDGEDEPPYDPTKDDDPSAPGAVPLKAASPATAASPQATSPALPARAAPRRAPPAAASAEPAASEAAK